MLRWKVAVGGRLWRFVGGQTIRLLLGAPLEGDGLLDGVRVDQLEDTYLLGDDLADLSGGEVRHQLSHQAAVSLRLQLTVFHWLLDSGYHGLVSAVFRPLVSR